MPDASRIRTAFFSNVLVLPEVGSTNDYLKQRAWELPSGTAAVTSRQTAGRGRLGRSFFSEGTLCLSLLIADLPSALRALMPYLCGLAVCDALGPAARLKWPNDVLMNNKKVCGILCETLIRGGESRTICGIGINLTQSRHLLSEQGLPDATSLLLETGTAPDFEKTSRNVLAAMENRLEQSRASSQALLSDYHRRCDTLGQDIRIVTPSEIREGTALGIAPDGGLRVRFKHGEETVYSGEVSIRHSNIEADSTSD